MNIYINEQLMAVDVECPLLKALEIFGAQPPFAVLYNGDFLPKSQHDSLVLIENDRIEVVSAIQGG